MLLLFMPQPRVFLAEVSLFPLLVYSRTSGLSKIGIRVFPQLLVASLVAQNQGDQIGRIFDDWRINFLK
jgi:hypothetical protein